MKLTKFIFFFIFSLWLISGFPVLAQSTPDEEAVTVRQPSADAGSNIMLARSSADYRVTPGDVYTLAYAVGSAPISYTITVDASYRIRVSNLGIINGAGKTFMQLKSEAEAIVARNYPLSGVQLVLTQPAIFRVYITGEVDKSGEISAWGLSRLSSLLTDGRLTGYASVRDIAITSSDGQTKVYDLFKAQRSGDLSQDPYLRPGDVITFNRIKRRVTLDGAVERPGTYQLLERENLQALIATYGNGLTPLADKARSKLTRYVGSAEISGDVILLTEAELTGDYELRDMDSVTIPFITTLRPSVPVNRLERTVAVSGAVRRPGTYELLPHENLKELIEVYADGFTAVADPSRMEMARLINSEDAAGDKLFLTEQDLANNFKLEHYDEITIPSIIQLQPVMFVEGAVARTEQSLDALGQTTAASASDLSSANRLVVQFAAGETYASLVRDNVDWFTAVSDTQNAYIIREAERIPINLNPMLYDAAYRGEVLVHENDILVIPFRQYFVTVAGAVMRPGRYPYVPDRDWEYYVGLAGGFVPDRNFRQAVTMRDISGKRLSKTSEIGPETVITASTNHLLFYFNQWAPVLTTVLSLAMTSMSIYFMTR